MSDVSNEIQKRLAEIEARANAATTGPWLWPVAGGISGSCGDHEEIFIERLDTSWENGKFIAHAREDIPWLIEQVRTLRCFVRNHIPASNAFDAASQEHGDLLKRLAE